VALEIFRQCLPDTCDFKGDLQMRCFAIDSLGVSIFHEYQLKGYALDATKSILQFCR
jgi:hypothetical protein